LLENEAKKLQALKKKRSQHPSPSKLNISFEVMTDEASTYHERSSFYDYRPKTSREYKKYLAELKEFSPMQGTPKLLS